MLVRAEKATCSLLNSVFPPSTTRRNSSIGSSRNSPLLSPAKTLCDSSWLYYNAYMRYHSNKPALGGPNGLKAPISSSMISNDLAVLEGMVKAGRVAAAYDNFQHIKSQNVIFVIKLIVIN